jgi:TRAP-type mannitol/chloroaromatic compound transport system permease large subunit
VIQAGSSLGILVPPSVVLVLYAMIARAAGRTALACRYHPGPDDGGHVHLYIAVRCKLQPNLGPPLTKKSGNASKGEKYRLLRLPASAAADHLRGDDGAVRQRLDQPGRKLGDRRSGGLACIDHQGPHDHDILILCLRNTLGISCMFMWIILAALGFGAVFDGLGAVKAIENLFTEQLGLSPWMILILMQLSFLVMGTFLDDTAMLVIVAPLYVPLVATLDLGMPVRPDLVRRALHDHDTDRLHDATVWLQPLPDAGNGAQGHHHAGHLRVDHAVCPGDGSCAGSCHGFPANRSLAA